jgi:hypothetical protein
MNGMCYAFLVVGIVLIAIDLLHFESVFCFLAFGNPWAMLPIMARDKPWGVHN